MPPAVRRPVSTVVRTAGKFTSSARILPSALIVGAQRAGTTSLHRTLLQHPAILGPLHKKGVHYFDVSYPQGGDWYQGHFPLRASVRRLAQRVGVPPIAIESSPYYMFHPLAATRFARDLPGVRVVVMLRDPIARAYSAYTHERARGFETAEFADALALEEERLAGEETRIHADAGYISHAHRHNAYLARGRYAEQLANLTAAVGSGRVHVVDSGDFFTDPAATYREVVAFLGLPDWPAVHHEQHNARPRTDLDAATAERLRAYFAPHDEQLATWLGWQPSWLR
ncbi:MAG: sulfotransferase [Streptosporangiales bacterium]|nr:sulfotransferase [Streptosporangiales bacterium]